MDQLINKANILVEEALPYIQKFKDTVFVVKYGGNAMVNETMKASVMKDIALLKTFGVHPVVVHGGGPDINKEMAKAGLKPEFVNGLRVTDAATLRIVRQVFKGINRDIRARLRGYNVEAREASGCLYARQKNPELGFVGDVTGVDALALQRLLAQGVIPVISSIGNDGRRHFNINADTAAVEVAIALRAEKLTILTDVDGVLENGRFLSHLGIREAQRHIQRGVITSGMIPKVEACVRAVRAGCHKAHLINGTISHALLFEIFTDRGIGTEVVRDARPRPA